MKTLVLKRVLPLMVFMMAIVFAFATENNTNKNDTLIPGYIFKNGLCQTAIRDCNNIGSIPCKENGFQVYMSKLSETVCAQPLYHWVP